MSYYINLGYRFKRPVIDGIKGSVIIADAITIQELTKRIDTKIQSYPHLENRLFDPQIYLSNLDAFQSPRSCTNLASYEWFGVGLEPYDSKIINRTDWKKDIKSRIGNLWKPSTKFNINSIKKACSDIIDFQIKLNCDFIILPAPLTSNPSTDYGTELSWLESGLDYVKSIKPDKKVYATVAIQDLCLKQPPVENSLISLITDALSTREFDGIYLVIEQGSEIDDSRHCSSSQTLQSVLHLTYLFSRYGHKEVFINSMGVFGLMCLAAGATNWATGWYKSLLRIRISDKIGQGRSYPSFWSSKLLTDIHLKADFDKIVDLGLLSQVVEPTYSSKLLIEAVQTGKVVDDIPDWGYRISNIQKSRDHFFESMAVANKRVSQHSPQRRIEIVHNWLRNSADLSTKIDEILGRDGKTKLIHQKSWESAFSKFREDHDL